MFKPFGENQAEYVRSIAENPITICTGPAGSGKTSVVAAMAAQYLEEGKVEKIIVSRPTVEAGKGLGFLPGDMSAKIGPYMVPILEELRKHMGDILFDKYFEQKIIEVLPLEFGRGRNFHNSFIILDEAANSTFAQMKMFISRIGKKSKLVINGDPDQTDLKFWEAGALEFIIEAFENDKNVGIVQLKDCDIVRNKIIGPLMRKMTNEAFQDFQQKRRDKNKVEQG